MDVRNLLDRITKYFPKKAYFGTENNFRQMVIIFIFFDFLVMEYVDVNTLSNEGLKLIMLSKSISSSYTF